MMNDSDKAISKYLAEVKRLLPFTCKVKRMLLEELRQRIGELTQKARLSHMSFLSRKSERPMR